MRDGARTVADSGSRVQLEPAWLLHRRRFRDSSDIAEFLTANHGRVACVARGLHRRLRGGSLAARLQPFNPLLISYHGRGELRTLSSAECVAAPARLQGRGLLAGLYLNELLMRALYGAEPTPVLLASYGEAIRALATGGELERILRSFEFGLLEALGYGLDLTRDASTGAAVVSGGSYTLDPQRGIVCAGAGGVGSFSGEELLTMARGEFGGIASEPAKRLLRHALAERLGPGALRSRELFRPAAPRGGAEP